MAEAKKTDKKEKSKKKKHMDPKKFNVLRAVEKDKLYESDPRLRDASRRKWITRNIEIGVPHDMLLGQMCSFKYFTPLTKEDLEYYDAMPVIIVFGRFTTEKGERRILGFNLHYYPPLMRYRLVQKIFEIFKGVYSDESVFEHGLDKDMSQIQYKELIQQLTRYKLEFGVREYAPNLIREIRVIPTKDFPKALLTEGHFRKKTRELILKYWSKFHPH